MRLLTELKKIALLDVALGVGFAVAVNAVLFGERYISDVRIFLGATFLTSTIGVALSHAHQLLAVRLNKQLGKRQMSGSLLMVHILFFR